MKTIVTSLCKMCIYKGCNDTPKLRFDTELTVYDIFALLQDI